MRMVKSLSQDTGCMDPTTPALTLHTSSSDSALHSKSVLSSTLRSTLGVTGYHGTQLSEVEESCSASDTGSINDLDGKKKKKKSFFNFRKKKDKTSSWQFHWPSRCSIWLTSRRGWGETWPHSWSGQWGRPTVLPDKNLGCWIVIES